MQRRLYHLLYHNSGNCEHHISQYSLSKPCSLSLNTQNKKKILSTQLQGNKAEIKVGERKEVSSNA
jgi:hypothetical protein